MTFVDDTYHRVVAPTDPYSVTWLHSVWASDPLWNNGGPAWVDGDLVGLWRNSSTAHLAAAGSVRPTYRASVEAFSKKPAVQFSGAQAVETNIVDQAQPFSLVAVCAFTSLGISQKVIGRGGNGGLGLTATNVVQLSAGTGLNGTSVVGSTAHLLRGYANGASSVVAVDGIVEATGNANTGNMARLAVGSAEDGTPTLSAFMTGYVAFVGVKAGDVTADAGWADFKKFVKDFYGIVTA